MRKLTRIGLACAAVLLVAGLPTVVHGESTTEPTDATHDQHSDPLTAEQMATEALNRNRDLRATYAPKMSGFQGYDAWIAEQAQKWYDTPPEEGIAHGTAGSGNVPYLPEDVPWSQSLSAVEACPELPPANDTGDELKIECLGPGDEGYREMVDEARAQAERGTSEPPPVGD